MFLPDIVDILASNWIRQAITIVWKNAILILNSKTYKLLKKLVKSQLLKHIHIKDLRFLYYLVMRFSTLSNIILYSFPALEIFHKITNMYVNSIFIKIIRLSYFIAILNQIE